MGGENMKRENEGRKDKGLGIEKFFDPTVSVFLKERHIERRVFKRGD